MVGVGERGAEPHNLSLYMPPLYLDTCGRISQPREAVWKHQQKMHKPPQRRTCQGEMDVVRAVTVHRVNAAPGELRKFARGMSKMHAREILWKREFAPRCAYWVCAHQRLEGRDHRGKAQVCSRATMRKRRDQGLQRKWRMLRSFLRLILNMGTPTHLA